MMVQTFVERLRPLVGVKGWDYIVFWKLSDDQRYLELMSCICAGTQNIQNNGEQLVFPASSEHLCRDVFFSHPRIKSCDLLDHVPSSVTLDSGIHAEVLSSNQACWLNFAYNSDLNASEDTIGTRVFVPMPLGLLELFVTRQVPQDQGFVDFIKSQCNTFLEQHSMNNSGCEDSRFSVNGGNGIHEVPTNLLFSSDASFQPQISDVTVKNSDYPHDISIDRIHLTSSPCNPLQNFGSTSEIMNKNKSILVGGTSESDPFNSLNENGFHEMGAFQGNMRRNASRLSSWMESSRSMEDCKNNEKMSSFTEENNKSDDSDPNDDDDENDVKYRKRNGKGQSKNLEAERKRRKKLNDRLYRLRALVPNISKLDRSAILGDAIDYVKELQQQVSNLQLELEERSEDENDGISQRKNTDKRITLRQNGTKRGPKRENETCATGFHNPSSGIAFKQNSEAENMNDKVQQMEPQVEVLQLDGNEFYIKVFCEYKPGGFVRLMEALNYLGLEVRNVNATRHTCLVSNIFKVEIRENESVQADYVKESLLELTRNPLTEWPNMGQTSYCAENRY